MKSLTLLLCALFLGGVLSMSERAPNPPTWPAQYTVTGLFQIPYFNLNEPVKIEYDATSNSEKISYYNGMDNYTYRFDLGVLYQVVPSVNTLKCFQPSIGNGPLVTVLPDLTNWTFVGKIKCSQSVCNRWEHKVTNFNRTDTYEFLESNGTPVLTLLNGYDYIFSSHPDVYVFRYLTYTPTVNTSSFVQPDLCKTSPPVDDSVAKRMVHRTKQLLGQLNSLTPSKLEDEFDLFMRRHHKYYFADEYESRRTTFNKNKEFIENFNKRTDKTHKLAINQFADLESAEMRAIMYPKPKDIERPARKASRVHTLSSKKLPPSINWVNLGAVTDVKDQGACGSCWTFGTTGTIEGTWFIQTGDLIPLSEQQLVDCAWVPWGGAGGNLGCDGGYASAAMDWIISNNGMATEASYPYLMQDHWCTSSDHSSGVTISGYVNVTEYDENALQDAVANDGPVAVAIDASHPEFTFYTSGVYYQSDCGYKPEDLDHEVLAVGYGTENGQDYWLVKNSWSVYWGDQGYIKMARNKNNNCGIASQATYAFI